MRNMFAFMLVIIGISVGCWLSIYIMLYGGIMAAIENWGTDNSAAAWGIIRAFFFEFGFIPTIFFVWFGITIAK